MIMFGGSFQEGPFWSTWVLTHPNRLPPLNGGGRRQWRVA
jgi:hypothetical protein